MLLPLRLQAGERLCLLLPSRISPNNLTGGNEPDFTAGELPWQIDEEIRNEFNHNLLSSIFHR